MKPEFRRTKVLGVDSGTMMIHRFRLDDEEEAHLFSKDVVLPPGRYNIQVVLSGRGDWGKRTAGVWVGPHVQNPHDAARTTVQSVGHFEVREGDAFCVSDPCYIFQDDYDGRYESTCNLNGTLSKDGSTFCSSSGYGDGDYPLYLAYEGDQLVGFGLRYIFEDDEVLGDEAGEEDEDT